MAELVFDAVCECSLPVCSRGWEGGVSSGNGGGPSDAIVFHIKGSHQALGEKRVERIKITLQIDSAPATQTMPAFKSLSHLKVD